ncbi:MULTISPECIES: hypothetical protein [Arthrobacter]|uniref:Uncharacterized protein n=1 Tax=Arthrobacter terricola TaxID=2547396 RepID=A0A4R5K984_9MICC|nr:MULTISPECIES: hypothetical protein [Arthrobacter]MBT8161723.1 hypothetical protein [Arthrobacter sp. GN70]TDF89407.1 hypothetical protein E1809_23095 [Arthrobacter terricola]
MSIGAQAGAGGIRFAAAAGSVSGYDRRGVDGTAYRWRGGYLFEDANGNDWWIVFQPSTSAGPGGRGGRGDVLACGTWSAGAVQVRVLASDVLREDADAVFRNEKPATLEDAVRAAGIIGQQGR